MELYVGLSLKSRKAFSLANICFKARQPPPRPVPTLGTPVRESSFQFLFLNVYSTSPPLDSDVDCVAEDEVETFVDAVVWEEGWDVDSTGVLVVVTGVDATARARRDMNLCSMPRLWMIRQKRLGNTDEIR